MGAGKLLKCHLVFDNGLNIKKHCQKFKAYIEFSIEVAVGSFR